MEKKGMLTIILRSALMKLLQKEDKVKYQLYALNQKNLQKELLQATPDDPLTDIEIRLIPINGQAWRGGE